MRYFNEQLVTDLEFQEIRNVLSSFAKQPTAAAALLELSPYGNFDLWKWTLEITHELKTLLQNDIAIPALDFKEFGEELKLLRVKDAVLAEESFAKILQGIRIIGLLKNIPEEVRLSVPCLNELIQTCEYTDEIEIEILKIFDAKWLVRDEASNDLSDIRQEIVSKRREISKNFMRVMKDCQGKGFLGDTGESYLLDRRVLSVLSVYKRKVPGNVLGTSKTGVLTYIEPAVNTLLNSQLEMLFGDERAEIRKILQRLTKYLSGHATMLKSVLDTLMRLDNIQARVRLAILMDAQKVQFVSEPTVKLNKAFHPLLLLKNAERGMKTIPQSLELNAQQRMMVISGPNAGGKSITLKTVGLIQLMWECALLVPAEESSVLSRFDCILTDIGDNQSIENQLSTYSYRLKRMKFFLDSANRRSLILLDEFGTGSDPELGGALAEVFFEELYARKSFGVITTHFSPIKIKASQLRNAVNGCMLFNTETLEPTYILSVGEPGSSFTFEVAKMNGIPEDLLDRAKMKLSKQKIEMDSLLSDLQRQKSELEQGIAAARKQEASARKEEQSFQSKLEKLQDKLDKQHVTSERNNKYIILGKKADQLVEKFNLRAKNKDVLEELKKFVAVEKTEREESRKKKKVLTESKAKNTTKEKVIQDRKKMISGATVRLEKTQQVGEILEVIGETATVAFGVFKTKVELGKLLLIR
ncbi:MAG: DNA mismatch repair protein MutS [Flavobacteriales bacterium]|nr:DNA mismatch repair protein MutS [Flavobacteriales bacterium]MDP4950834.1 DNA mismatch repair protein MutS [Flavobacteriales bacterium]